jgi:hypothetical protein
MKQIIMSVALTAFAAVAPLGAQGRNGNQGIPPGQMPPAGMCRIWINGVPPGRQPRPTDCATARARVPANARVIYGSNTNNGRYNNQDCTYSRSTNSVGDIIFGRTGNNTNCVDNSNRRVSGGWYQVGNDRYGAVYERRTRDRNGNLIVQRARRNSNGTLSVFSTRNVGSNGTYNNGRDNDGRYNNDRYNNDQDNSGRYDNARYDNSGNNGTWNSRRDRDDDDQGDDNEGRGKDKDKGHGKGHGNGHGKGHND